MVWRTKDTRAGEELEMNMGCGQRLARSCFLWSRQEDLASSRLSFERICPGVCLTVLLKHARFNLLATLLRLPIFKKVGKVIVKSLIKKIIFRPKKKRVRYSRVRYCYQ